MTNPVLYFHFDFFGEGLEGLGYDSFSLIFDIFEATD